MFSQITLALAKNIKMFSTGQIVFAILFLIGFVTILIGMYRKDRIWHKKHYKGAVWVLFFFVCFVLILLTMKYILRN